MEKKLNEIKKLGNYAIVVFFGEDIGCDDLDVPEEDRNIVCSFYPIGYLGGLKILWKGKMKDFKSFDFSSKPNQISNPPKREEYKEDGYYMWGSYESVKSFIAKGK